VAGLITANAVAHLIYLTSLAAAIFEAHASVCAVGARSVSGCNVELGFVGAAVRFGQNVLAVFWSAEDVRNVMLWLVVVPPGHNVALRVLEDRVDEIQLLPSTLVLITLIHLPNVGRGRRVTLCLAAVVVRRSTWRVRTAAHHFEQRKSTAIVEIAVHFVQFAVSINLFIETSPVFVDCDIVKARSGVFVRLLHVVARVMTKRADTLFGVAILSLAVTVSVTRLTFRDAALATVPNALLPTGLEAAVNTNFKASFLQVPAGGLLVRVDKCLSVWHVCVERDARRLRGCQVFVVFPVGTDLRADHDLHLLISVVHGEDGALCIEIYVALQCRWRDIYRSCPIGLAYSAGHSPKAGVVGIF